jgi:hypothetical protein
VLRTPGLAETLPPSGIPLPTRSQVTKEQRAAAAGAARAESSRDAEDTGTSAMSQLEQLSALVERAVRKSGPAAESSPAAPSSSASKDAPEEEALETYLDRFMERLTGKKADVAEPVAQTVPGMPAFLVQPDRPAQPVAKAPPVLPREPSRPPECRETLTAMRELANHNARSAVAHHATNDLSGRVRLALAAAAGSSLISCGLASAALSFDSRGCLWGSAVAACVAAVVACRFFILCGKFQDDRVPSGEA